MTGIGMYAYNLIRELGKQNPQDTFKLYSYAFRGGLARRVIKLPNSGEDHMFPSLKTPSPLLYLQWKYIGVPKIESILGDVDIVHCLDLVLPPATKAKRVITVYDLTLMIMPETHPWTRVNLYPRALRYSLNNADAILVISESTKRDLLRFFDVDEKLVTVTYCGIDHQIFRPFEGVSGISEVKKKYGITGKYIYYIGTIEPRKGVNVLLEAFSSVKKKTQGDVRLVISGKKGWMVEDLMKKIASGVEAGDVVYTGYVENDEAAALYNGAEVFAYPSLYEGFGIPVAEAMACGCPVITTNSSSLPEVAGDAGLLVRPNDPGDLAAAILKVLDDKELRSTMRERSIGQAGKFDWATTSQVTRGVYEKILGS